MTTILQVLPALKGGGVERGTIEISQSIVNNGMKSLVVSAGGQMLDELKKTGAEHITLNVATKNPFKIYKNINKIANIIQKYNVSLVHVRSRAPAWSVYFAAKKTNIPMLTTFHGIFGLSPKIKKYYNAIMTKGEKIIAISEYIKNHLLENYDVKENKIVVIPRGADTNRFDPSKINPADISELRKKWEIPEGMPVVLMPTRISPVKGIEIFIKAMQKTPDVFCAVVGSDHGKEAYKKELTAKVKQLGMDKYFRFYEPLKNIEVAYALSDMVLTSIRPEAFGRTITEAQAMGKIPIAANVGAATEIIENGENGYLVDVTKPEETAEVIKLFLSLSEKEHKEMVSSAIHNVVSKYSVAQMCESTIHLYKDILSEDI